MAITMKRGNPTTEEQHHPNAKRIKNFLSLQNLRVAFNPADCDLAFNIEADGRIGHALYEQGFAYCWSGARGNIGITGGKYCFGCRIISGQPVNMEDTSLDQQHVSRVGISRGDDPVGNLGETKKSFGYGGTGKFSTDGKFEDHCEKFGIGDMIVCLVDLESKPWASIEFSKNGKRLGIAKQFDVGPKGLGVIDSPCGNLPWESALFPHVLLKNTVVEMQFSTEDGLVPVEGYKPWASAVEDGKAVIGPAFSDPQDCEVIMMVGLPAAGKSTWAEKWSKEHPEKRYIVLGTNLALDQMKIPGLLRKYNYSERFDRLMDWATGIFNTLLSRASNVSRNYIIDQTNVYKSARRRKLKPFANFHRIAVVVFPRQEELKLRGAKRFKEMGKEVPPEAVNEMLENFVLPKSKDMSGADEYFDEVNRGYTGVGHHVVSESMQPFSFDVNTRYESPGFSERSEPSAEPYYRKSLNPMHPRDGYPGTYSSYSNSGLRQDGGYPGTYSNYSIPGLREHGSYPRIYSSNSNPISGNNRAPYDSYMHDPCRTNEVSYSYGTGGFGNSAEEARSAHQPPYVSPYVTPPLLRPQGRFPPADGQHPGTVPYHPPSYPHPNAQHPGTASYPLPEITKIPSAGTWDRDNYCTDHVN